MEIPDLSKWRKSMKGGAPNAILDKIGVTENECSLSGNKKGECMSDSVRNKIARELDVKPKSLRKVLEKKKTAAGCDTDMCIFRRMNLDNEMINNIKKFYRPAGPSDSIEWLSNFQIEDVLGQLAKKIQGFEYPKCQMRDFEKIRTELARVDIHELLSKGVKYYGVVMNTDVSSGSGEHWNVLMVSKQPDKKIHIEFFDSTARTIPNEVNTWILNTAELLRSKGHDIIIDRNYGIELQKEDHSCGIWSLIYIFARVSGMSISQILRSIDETTMDEARKRLFSGSD